MKRLLVLLLMIPFSIGKIFAQNKQFASQTQIPSEIKKLNNGNTLYDFKKPFFGKILVSVKSLHVGDSIVVMMGEKLDASGQIDRKPGGNIRSNKYVFVKKNIGDSNIYFPNVANLKNTSGNAVRLPESMGILIPFRFVEVEKFQKQIDDFTLNRTIFFYPFNDNNSSFSSSDTILNLVWNLCKHTIKATSFSGYYIDGDRERIPYEADALINQLSHYAVDTGYGLARNTIEHLMAHPTWPTEWHLQMHQIVYNDYIFTGNTELIKKYYDLLKLKTLDAFKQPNGLISTTANPQRKSFLDSIHYITFDAKQGLRDITDWPQKGNNILGPSYIGESDGFVFCTYNSIINAFHYKSLLIMKRFAEILKKQDDIKYFETASNNLFKIFNTYFTDNETGLIKDGDTTTHSSQHANFFALDFGLVKDENKPKVLDYIKSKGMACSVYGSQFLLDGLYNSDGAEQALQLMTSKSDRSWYHMIELGAGMTTEAWDIKFKPNQDWNHAWGAAPANIIAFKLMGIKPISPAFSNVLIQPQIGHLKNAEYTLPTLKGAIVESISQNDIEYRFKLKLPKGVFAKIILPKFSDNISVKSYQGIKRIPVKQNTTWIFEGVNDELEVVIKK